MSVITRIKYSDNKCYHQNMTLANLMSDFKPMTNDVCWCTFKKNCWNLFLNRNIRISIVCIALLCDRLRLLNN